MSDMPIEYICALSDRHICNERGYDNERRAKCSSPYVTVSCRYRIQCVVLDEPKAEEKAETQEIKNQNHNRGGDL